MIKFLIDVVCVFIVLIFYASSVAICLSEFDFLQQYLEEKTEEEEEEFTLEYFHPIEEIFFYVFIAVTTFTPFINCIMAEICHSNKTGDIIMNIVRKRNGKKKIGG